MDLLIIGSSGQLARALCERARVRGVSHAALGRPDFDLTKTDGLEHVLERHAPRVVINAAASTAVDDAETAPDASFALNAQAPGALADATAKTGARLIHISTDFVFDGRNDAPYRETDRVNPLNVYGRSKAEGEARVLARDPDALVVRTAWVYSPFGKNFVKTMLRLAADRDVVRVVDDQRGNPTSALDLADALLTVAAGYADVDAVSTRVLHVAGGGEASWADLADHVFAVSRQRGGPSAEVERIASSAYPTAAQRPADSRLDCRTAQTDWGVCLPDWRDGAEACVARLVQARGD